MEGAAGRAVAALGGRLLPPETYRLPGIPEPRWLIVAVKVRREVRVRVALAVVAKEVIEADLQRAAGGARSLMKIPVAREWIGE